MAYTTIDDPSVYFQTTLYTGNGGTQSITNTGNSDLQPDWIWIKSRNEAEHHNLVDSVRGNTKVVYSSLTGAEDTTSIQVTSFASDGFALGSGTNTNKNTITYAAWQWKAGTSFTNDASSTGIGTIDSAGSVNQDAGFSICTYTGTGSAGTIKHGLNKKPTFWMTKARSEARAWYGWHQGFALGDVVNFNSTNAATTDTSLFSTTAPTSSVYNVGTSVGTNNSGITFVNYLFHDVAGYSKFGSYTGNGNADGTFVYTGFKPALIIFKNADSGSADWVLYDNKRDGFNSNNIALYPNANAADDTGNDPDILSNGFKQRATGSDRNGNGENIIYMAFAENPFVTSGGLPGLAE